MDDDERERLAHSVENMMGYSGGKPVSGRKIAAQLRADGQRIKALEAGLRDVLAVIEDSRGVDGLHLNGDIASWDEVLGPDFDAAAALLTAARERQGDE